MNVDATHRLRLSIYLLILLFGYALSDHHSAEAESNPVETKRLVKRNAGLFLDVGNLMNHRELKIGTVAHEPYTFIKSVGGKKGFSGFIPDLIFKLSRHLRFTYHFYEVDKFGSYDNNTATWSGLIGQVIKNENDSSKGADLGAGAIVVTSRREKVVDFVKPFQHLGLSVVVKRPTVKVDELVSTPFSFSIFAPLTPAVWLLALMATVVVGLFLWLMNMYNPYEWGGRHALGLADNDQSQAFNLSGSLYFVFSTLTWQGYDRSPISIASRFLTVIWFAFVAIFLVTYAAGIVNLLLWSSTLHRRKASESIFKDLEHLVMSNKFKIGVIAGGQTYKYITEVAVGEEFDIIRHMWEEQRDLLVANEEEGLQRVRKENFAFIMETMSAKYAMTRKPCDLMTLGNDFAMKSYGFAVPSNSLALEAFHIGILELTEEGEIEALEARWFKGLGQCWNATVLDSVVQDISAAVYLDKPASVGMAVFWSPFVLLLVGAVMSVGIAFAEMMYYRQWGRYKSSNQPQVRQLKLDADDGTIS